MYFNGKIRPQMLKVITGSAYWFLILSCGGVFFNPLWWTVTGLFIISVLLHVVGLIFRLIFYFCGPGFLHRNRSKFILLWKFSLLLLIWMILWLGVLVYMGFCGLWQLVEPKYLCISEYPLKSQILVWCVSPCIWCDLFSLQILVYFILCTFSVLIIWHARLLYWSCLFGVLYVSCSLLDIPLLRLGKLFSNKLYASSYLSMSGRVSRNSNWDTTRKKKGKFTCILQIKKVKNSTMA